MLDLIVFGEVCEDTLQLNDEEFKRPGGAFYSAYAGTRIGLNTAILGEVGHSNSDELLNEMQKYGVDCSYIKKIAGETTRYILSNIDEVLPQTATILKNSLVENDFNDIPKSKAALFYPGPNLAKNIANCPALIKALDVQYDIDTILNIEEIKDIDIIFLSTSDIVKTEDTAIEFVQRFLEKGVKHVIYKFGPGGSRIYNTDNTFRDVPSLKSNYICTVGAGDVYNAIFTGFFANGQNIDDCGIFAAAAASIHIENLEFERTTNWDLKHALETKQKLFLPPNIAKSKKVYLAGPLFSFPEQILVRAFFTSLKKHGFHVFSPLHENGVFGESTKTKPEIFDWNLEKIRDADVIVALLDYEDPGTVYECGYALGLEKQIIGFQSNRKSLNIMVDFGVSFWGDSIRSVIDKLLEMFSEEI